MRDHRRGRERAGQPHARAAHRHREAQALGLAPSRTSEARVPDPAIQEPTDAIVGITTTALCGDPHLYEKMAAFLDPGDILGHEPMGIEEVGSEVTNLRHGDRVVIPFQVPAAAATCAICSCTPSAPQAYDMFQREEDGAIKVLFRP